MISHESQVQLVTYITYHGRHPRLIISQTCSHCNYFNPGFSKAKIFIFLIILCHHKVQGRTFIIVSYDTRPSTLYFCSPGEWHKPNNPQSMPEPKCDNLRMKYHCCTMSVNRGENPDCRTFPDSKGTDCIFADRAGYSSYPINDYLPYGHLEFSPSQKTPSAFVDKWAGYSEVGYLDDLLISPSVGVAETSSSQSSKTHRTASCGPPTPEYSGCLIIQQGLCHLRTASCTSSYSQCLSPS
ncbi:uncharacterized protein P174DRAFT_281303 [Aspergillus novofumigatus IBT 16806]|uniref:Uncharacterized protein n=1 Tax=Aspergillus novofumigatus (strain IBT 16806) TaxID=1392255 RepID=A0A2I1C051_ASPN1|nr:uncharacterized protein P174DRAFT_281303 [Aspergillus novofumigatus IBT 16806]PKX91016.1 hypothetical protein P174DRAFT_281303 [Aspergillus novofumigatus IBT 16806]